VKFLPIVARELRMAARRRSTYFLRTGAAFGLIILGTWMFLMLHREAPRQVASVMFGLLAGCASMFCLLSGVQSTSDCISREKREGTLGLLFLTDLKGYDVVLGKLVASSIHGLYSVFAIVPMLAIPLLLGGVAPGEFWRMALVAINTLFFSLTIGICTSALSSKARQAAAATFLSLVVLAGLLPLLGLWISYMSKGAVNGSWLYLTSPGFAFAYAFDALYRMQAWYYWGSMAVVHGIAWAALVLACVITPRVWKERPASVAKLRFRENIAQYAYGSSLNRAEFRHRLLNVNPFYWLAARARWKPAAVWFGLALIGCGWVWGRIKFKEEWLSSPLYVVTGLVLIMLIKGWFASECGRQLGDERQGGTLELLLSTPLTVRDILRGQTLALQRQFLGPTVCIVVILMVLMIAGLSDVTRDQGVWFAVWIGSILLLPADLAAIYWVGIWQGITAKNPARAANGTVLRILVLPWILYAGCMLITALASMQGNHEPDWPFFVGLWLFLSVAADLGFGIAARYQILTSFREAATQPYRGPLSSLKDIFTAR